MAELTNEQYSDYVEDEFGLPLKAFLGVRVIFYVIGIFMILGALLCVAIGLTDMDVLVSNATGLSATAVDANFGGYQVCMFVQAAYTILSAAAAGLLLIKRTKIFAIADVALFVILLAAVFATGSADILFNGSAWTLYLLLNPIFSFAGLFGGKHFKYMPLK